MTSKELFQYVCAAVSLAAAIILAFVAFLMSENNDVTGNVLILVAQFLLFAASIFGISGFIEDIKHLTKTK